jgi:maintenance of morphology protein 1
MYDPQFHQPETCEWLNVLIAQTIAKYRNDKGFNNRIINMIHHSLNNTTYNNKFLGPISITELSLGEEFPLLKGACIRFAEETSNMVNNIWHFTFHSKSSYSKQL